MIQEIGYSTILALIESIYNHVYSLALIVLQHL